VASSGVTAWAKYYQGRGNLPTMMKKESPIYDVTDTNKNIGTITAGTKIIYISSKTYESKALVEIPQYNGRGSHFVRVSFDAIAKPGVRASAAVSLKPQSFGIGEQKYLISEYAKVVANHIEDRKDLTPELRSYLAAIFDYYATGNTTADQVTAIFNAVKSDIPINDINKDFGEVLGPVACYKLQLFKSKGIVLSNAARVYVPERPNEPLMDYGLYDGKKQYIISAKSGTTTNTVKPSDILNLLKKNPKKATKWNKSKEWKLLQMLAENSILVGPIKAVAAIYGIIPTEAANTVTRLKYDEKAFAKFIKENDYLKTKNKPTVNEIMYECEKLIQKDTKEGNLNMNEIFSAAIAESVLYVKFLLDPSGVGTWKVTASDDVSNIKSHGRAFLRTKNGYRRAADRMGVQI
jgi:hypothetical protein